MKTAESIHVISVIDPAFDSERAGPERLFEYLQKRDFDIVKGFSRPGQMMTVYHLRRIPRNLFLHHVMSGATEHLRFVEAFRCSVVHVDNLYTDDGARVSWEPTGQLGDLTVVSVAEMERFDPATILEVGSVAWYDSFLPRRIERRFAVPPTLASLLRTLPCPDPVVVSQTTPATASVKPSVADSAAQARIDQTGESTASE